MHVKGQPLILYNAWDAGSARAISAAGVSAIATSSWAVAAAHGYEDGERLPIAISETVIARIVATTDLPVTVDIEGGYAEEDEALVSFAILIIGGIAFPKNVYGVWLRLTPLLRIALAHLPPTSLGLAGLKA